MRSILLVKTSSLGDVVHNLPVASDIHRAFPDAAIDWVVEEHFAAIPSAHRAVRRVVPVAIRRWRRAPWRRSVRAEFAAFSSALRRERYDAVIDTQGLLKSALIARLARGARYGFDWKSSREPLAVFYSRTFSVPRAQHAVERNRALAALTLSYAPAAEIDYGIRASQADFEWLAGNRYAVFVHSTSAERKLWPGAKWLELGQHFAQRSIACVLPWGNSSERQRSERLARDMPGSIVPPLLALRDVMALFSGSRCVIGVDTGLTHLAAALGAATVGIYGPTDPARTGVYGSPRGINVGGARTTPQVIDVIRAVEQVAP